MVDGTWLCEGYGLQAVERVCDHYHRPSLCHPERSRGICSSPNPKRTSSEVAVMVDGTWLCEGYGLQAVERVYDRYHRSSLCHPAFPMRAQPRDLQFA